MNGEKEKKEILQSEFRKKIDNWNFIKTSDKEIEFLNSYISTSDSIASYYDHKLAKVTFGNPFWFDGGYSIDEKKMKVNSGDFIYPKINNKYFIIRDAKGYWDDIRSGNSEQLIKLRQANQGFNLLDSKYKVIWSYANPQRFFYSDKPLIWARNQFNAIGSNNKPEILYLLALLNSTLNAFVLRKYLYTNNEKDFLIAGKSIKQYIRIPIITDANKSVKNEIIKQAAKMIDLENVKLKEIIDFSSIFVQKFNSVRVEKNSLILSDFSGEIYELNIPSDQIRVVGNIFQSKSLFNDEITLLKLKNTQVVDFEKQNEIKKYIDDLVFALYFNIDLPNLGIAYANQINVLCRRHINYETLLK